MQFDLYISKKMCAKKMKIAKKIYKETYRQRPVYMKRDSTRDLKKIYKETYRKRPVYMKRDSTRDLQYRPVYIKKHLQKRPTIETCVHGKRPTKETYNRVLHKKPTIETCTYGKRPTKGTSKRDLQKRCIQKMWAYIFIACMEWP